MAYEWVDNGPESHVSQVAFTVSNGTFCWDFNGNPCGEVGENPTWYIAAATLMGQIKDALEDAGLTVGNILSGKQQGTILEDVP